MGANTGVDATEPEPEGIEEEDPLPPVDFWAFVEQNLDDEQRELLLRGEVRLDDLVWDMRHTVALVSLRSGGPGWGAIELFDWNGWEFLDIDGCTYGPLDLDSWEALQELIGSVERVEGIDADPGWAESLLGPLAQEGDQVRVRQEWYRFVRDEGSGELYLEPVEDS
jgi:hypothetical protein